MLCIYYIKVLRENPLKARTKKKTLNGKNNAALFCIFGQSTVIKNHSGGSKEPHSTRAADHCSVGKLNFIILHLSQVKKHIFLYNKNKHKTQMVKTEKKNKK